MQFILNCLFLACFLLLYILFAEYICPCLMQDTFLYNFVACRFTFIVMPNTFVHNWIFFSVLLNTELAMAEREERGGESKHKLQPWRRGGVVREDLTTACKSRTEGLVSLTFWKHGQRNAWSGTVKPSLSLGHSHDGKSPGKSLLWIFPVHPAIGKALGTRLRTHLRGWSPTPPMYCSLIS